MAVAEILRRQTRLPHRIVTMFTISVILILVLSILSYSTPSSIMDQTRIMSGKITATALILSPSATNASFDDNPTGTEKETTIATATSNENVSSKNNLIRNTTIQRKSNPKRVTRMDDMISRNQSNLQKSAGAGVVANATNLHDSKTVPPLLLPWELESIQTRKCEPGLGIPQYCCMGSVSKSGVLKYVAEECTRTNIYDNVRDHSIQYLHDNFAHDPVIDEENCDACRIVSILLDYNLTLSFVGDSLTRQVAAGFQCELLRRGGYTVETKRWPWAKAWDRRCDTSAFCIQEKLEYIIVETAETTRIGNYSGGKKSRTTSVFYYGMYRPGPDDEIQNQIIATSDIVIFDHGLHWEPTYSHRFFKAMKSYLQIYHNSNLTLLAWRETSAQHFEGAHGGHFGQPGGSLNTCGAIGNDTARSSAFRRKPMRKAAQQAKLVWQDSMDANFVSQPWRINELVFLPYRDFTVPLHYVHPLADCTHYCHTPDIWTVIWRNLRLAMERSVRGKPLPDEKVSR